MDKLKLKPGKEKPLLNRHPWVFSGAVAKFPSCPNGALVAVESASGVFLGTAFYNRRSSIVARMIAFGEQNPLEALQHAIREAIFLRKMTIGKDTSCFRLINAEGDFLPGLIVDCYGDYLVVQISTLGIDCLKQMILQVLCDQLAPKAIYEKSLTHSRKEEGLKPLQDDLYGSIPEEFEVLENGLKFIVRPKEGQKTGFFLDQREMRAYIRTLSKQKSVLNCFSYTGGFSVYALAGEASKVDSVDISESALKEAKRNCVLNGFSSDNARFYNEDVFHFLRRHHLEYDIIILDPPAFAKRAKDVIAACRGYKEINRIALQKMPSHSFLITCSCSYFIDEKLFQQVVFQAAAEAKRNVRIVSHHRQAADHPINLFHPEGSYLKSLVLFVE